jgi:hypothetical protein
VAVEAFRPNRIVPLLLGSSTSCKRSQVTCSGGWAEWADQLMTQVRHSKLSQIQGPIWGSHSLFGREGGFVEVFCRDDWAISSPPLCVSVCLCVCTEHACVFGRRQGKDLGDRGISASCFNLVGTLSRSQVHYGSASIQAFGSSCTQNCRSLLQPQYGVGWRSWVPV